MERTSEINGYKRVFVQSILDKDSQPIKRGGRLFPRFCVIKYKGKKTIVFSDRRYDNICVVCDWYDDIIGMNWSGNYKKTDLPCVVVNDGKYNLLTPHNDKLLLDPYVRYIQPEWSYTKSMGYHVQAIGMDGIPIIITKRGTIYRFNECNTRLLTSRMKIVKRYNNYQILKEWIERERPCGYTSGIPSEDDNISLISPEQAEILIQSHHTFHGLNRSASWVYFDGKVILLFHDNQESFKDTDDD